jgi:hypothetical protein
MVVGLDVRGAILFNHREKLQFHVWVGFTAIDAFRRFALKPRLS